MDYSKLFHVKEDFDRETFLKRMEAWGFKNMARMELFLWDLELFLQIQKILGDRIVLKGGAATQLIDLWGINVQTDAEAKKNFARQNVR